MLSFLAAHRHIADYALQVARACVWLALLTAVFAPLEHWFSVRPGKLIDKNLPANLGWYFINSLTPSFLLGPASMLLALAVHAVLPASVTSLASGLPLGARLTLAVVVGEVGFYWGHRFSHEIPFLWRFHAVHHSARRVNFLVNTRAHPVDMVFTRLCGFTLLYATGLASTGGSNPALVPALVMIIGVVWSFFIHANVRWRLGPLEEVIASPFFHHWHHTLEDHRDHNYATLLPVMDRVFGTFHRPEVWPDAYGIDGAMPDDLAGQLLAPFAPRSMAARAINGNG